ncbi:pyridoxamine 5'-phosphate oxidase family protein [Rhodococcus sp. IEGM 1307]|uniref:pyridoxamine 5'-phosphate oxidase family protein n=1 Tax=Rhodococcus sp. IEGM 1307 TaxID=3047091 RepID=UPI0024B788D1|nr:pyridoxamine 5'-phosphate oxidase family protein [Rhodococcus sp. IEGM 1307]MDI9973605.1 pyridoxamine 5'-phosphate oxidase family protein [Rhodococcus sp. IEGM 1307]
MTNWTQFETEAPDLAKAVAARFEAHKHHVLATLRKDGSPRVSGTEVEFYEGALLLGSMVGARKVQDLQRDPRFSLHSNPGHHTMVLTTVDGDHLYVDLWRPGAEVTRFTK